MKLKRFFFDLIITGDKKFISIQLKFMPNFLESITEVNDKVIGKNNQSLTDTINNVNQTVVTDKSDQKGEEKKKKNQTTPSDKEEKVNEVNESPSEEKEDFFTKLWKWAKSLFAKNDNYQGDPDKATTRSDSQQNNEESNSKQNQQQKEEQKEEKVSKTSNKQDLEENKEKQKEERKEKNSNESSHDPEQKSGKHSKEEIAAMTNLLKGMKAKAKDGKELNKMLWEASGMVADMEPAMVEQWQSAIKESLEQNPNLKNVANGLAIQIEARCESKRVSKDLKNSPNINTENIDKNVVTPEMKSTEKELER